MKGIIASDIDGTITDSPFHMPDTIKETFHRAYDAGWRLIFITGRPYVWGIKPLLALDFPYYIAVINGANLIEMPSGKLIEEKLISKKSLPLIDKICEKHKTDYVVYSGYSCEDIVYYRPERFDQEERDYLNKRTSHVGETWVSIEDYQDTPCDGFASIKCFGDATRCQALAKELEDTLELHVPVIRDPFGDKRYVAQATEKSCTKGLALERFARLVKNEGPIIAAGDDINDITMLQSAQIRIVMSTAPPEVLALADIIAKPAAEGGLAKVLDQLIY